MIPICVDLPEPIGKVYKATDGSEFKTKESLYLYCEKLKAEDNLLRHLNELLPNHFSEAVLPHAEDLAILFIKLIHKNPELTQRWNYMEDLRVRLKQSKNK